MGTLKRSRSLVLVLIVLVLASGCSQATVISGTTPSTSSSPDTAQTAVRRVARFDLPSLTHTQVKRGLIRVRDPGVSVSVFVREATKKGQVSVELSAEQTPSPDTQSGVGIGVGFPVEPKDQGKTLMGEIDPDKNLPAGVYELKVEAVGVDCRVKVSDVAPGTK
jgi:hypothetical protein